MELRRYSPDDEAALIEMWHETKVRAYPYLPTEQSYTLEMDTEFFRQQIAPQCTLWVATAGDQLIGFLALDGSTIDRLFIHPDHQREGVGTALIEKAKALSPRALELHTHQQNISGCSFYEKHGFRVARYGTSGPPESAPDIEYRWRPDAD